MGNTFGEILRLTTFGESHGAALGGIIDGLPARLRIDRDTIDSMMAARRPGSGPNVTQRREDDRVEILSGVSSDGLTLGTPIGFIIRNNDARSGDYDHLRDVYRPGHADFTYQMKYGIRDHRGGGRASARETAVRVAAAAIVTPLLGDINVTATVTSIGGITAPQEWPALLKAAALNHDSVGGTVQCVATGVPVGLGEPVFGKLQARLASAIFSIPGVKGFEYGGGFAMADKWGSEVADPFITDDNGQIVTDTNFSGGIQGGITKGDHIVMRVAFKPTPSIGQPLQTVDTAGRPVTLNLTGRHDPCIAIRGAAVVRAMVILTLADALLAARINSGQK